MDQGWQSWSQLLYKTLVALHRKIWGYMKTDIEPLKKITNFAHSQSQKLLFSYLMYKRPVQ